MGPDEKTRERTRLRISELRQRVLEIAERRQQLAREDAPGGSSPDDARRAAERAERALANAAAARTHAELACRRSADAHEAAARRYEALAEAGFGDTEEHQRKARLHREMCAADRYAARQGVSAP